MIDIVHFCRRADPKRVNPTVHKEEQTLMKTEKPTEVTAKALKTVLHYEYDFYNFVTQRFYTLLQQYQIK